MQGQGLSPDWKMNIAYNAALQAATAALAACGFRVAREAHHFRVIRSLQHTVGIDDALIIQFEQFRKQRNIISYEQAGAVSEREADEMMELAREIRDRIVWWLQVNHPDLLK